MRALNSLLALSLALAAMQFSLPARAAEKDPAREQARRLQLMQRKFEQEKTLLMQEKTALETQLKEAGEKVGKLATVEQAALGAERRAAGLAGELAKLRSEHEQLKTRLGQAQAETRQLAETHRKDSDRRAAEHTALSGQLEQRSKSLTQCEASNLLLYQYGVDLLQRHTGLPVANPLAVLEPFTGLRQVEMENLLEEYHEKFESQKLGQSVPPVEGAATAVR